LWSKAKGEKRKATLKANRLDGVRLGNLLCPSGERKKRDLMEPASERGKGFDAKTRRRGVGLTDNG